MLAHVPGGGLLVLATPTTVDAFSHTCLQSLDALSSEHKLSPELQHYVSHLPDTPEAQPTSCDDTAQAVQDCPARTGRSNEFITLQTHFADTPQWRPPRETAQPRAGPRNSTLGVHNLHGHTTLTAPEAFALAAAADWADSLTLILGLPAGAVRGGSGLLEVDVLPQQAAAAAQLLASQDLVAWVGLAPVRRHHDLTASTIIQSGAQVQFLSPRYTLATAALAHCGGHFEGPLAGRFNEIVAALLSRLLLFSLLTR